MSTDQLLPVPDGLIGMRIDQAVSKMLGISRSRVDALLASGDVSVDGREVTKSSKLTATDIIIVRRPDSEPVEEPISTEMGVLYEDEDVIVVDKPVGVAAHASPGWTGLTVLGSLLKRGVTISTYGPPTRRGIVSRLDVGTSGAMLVCKSNLAYVEMRKQFANHDVEKIYHALAQGVLKNDKATIDAPIGRAKSADFRFAVSPIGKPAITHFDVLERFDEATLASVNLETGRTHQIRVHFSSIGHPLVGDSMYGANAALSRRLGLQRQWLHAVSLGFRHPRTHVWTVVKSEYPADLQNALRILRDGAQRRA